MTFSRTKTKKT